MAVSYELAGGGSGLPVSRSWRTRARQSLWWLWEAGATGPVNHGVVAWLLVVLQDLARWSARVFVALAFFNSGLTKLRDWDITLALFEDEYHVPLLPSHLAAWLGTGGELLLPVLLILGFGGRFAALGLSVVNVVAVASLTEVAPAALGQHQLWGVMLLAVALFGPGRWSLDHFVARCGWWRR